MPAPLRLALARHGLLLALVIGSLTACDRSKPSPTPTTAPPAAASTVPPAPAATPATQPGAGLPVSAADRTFAAEAASSGLGEAEASRFIAGLTSDARLKEYALQMEREHSSANDELIRIASGHGIVLPATPEGEIRSQLERLRGLKGSEAERAFVQDFGIDAHTRAITLFEGQVREGQMPDLRGFAERTLPKLREHLSMARQLQSR